ncbi:MAG: hypothetical protein JW762_13085 [Dehalococcoidales bacterium]|nr:hypothetical protein [Dehalococcoidales bacterium]
MQVAALIVSIFAIIGMFFGFIPFLGWMNWGVIPVAIIGLVLSIIAMATSKKGKGMAIAGLVMCIIAIIIGAIRLVIGGGIL